MQVAHAVGENRDLAFQRVDFFGRPFQAELGLAARHTDGKAGARNHKDAVFDGFQHVSRLAVGMGCVEDDRHALAHAHLDPAELEQWAATMSLRAFATSHHGFQLALGDHCDGVIGMAYAPSRGRPRHSP